jgi:hypothetical protein
MQLKYKWSRTLFFLFPLLITLSMFSCTLKPEIFTVSREATRYRSICI